MRLLLSSNWLERLAQKQLLYKLFCIDKDLFYQYKPCLFEKRQAETYNISNLFSSFNLVKQYLFYIDRNIIEKWEKLENCGIECVAFTTHEKKNEGVEFGYLKKFREQFSAKIPFLLHATEERSYLPNPSARAGYDTRSIFKRNLSGLNLEFSFS